PGRSAFHFVSWAVKRNLAPDRLAHQGVAPPEVVSFHRFTSPAPAIRRGYPLLPAVTGTRGRVPSWGDSGNTRGVKRARFPRGGPGRTVPRRSPRPGRTCNTL